MIRKAIIVLLTLAAVGTGCTWIAGYKSNGPRWLIARGVTYRSKLGDHSWLELRSGARRFHIEFLAAADRATEIEIDEVNKRNRQRLRTARQQIVGELGRALEPEVESRLLLEFGDYDPLDSVGPGSSSGINCAWRVAERVGSENYT